jgi:hypothetical protein
VGPLPPVVRAKRPTRSPGPHPGRSGPAGPGPRASRAPGGR